MRAWAFALGIFLWAAEATAQDYERERRWAAEVVPGLVVGDAVRLPLPDGRDFLGLFSQGQAGKPAVLLVHGSGVHPDHGVIGIMRVALADMGYATLSIQMPVLAPDAAPGDYHPALFPEALERIAAGARWLGGKGFARPVLVTHSLGSWMANAYFETVSASPFAGWVCMGRSGPFGGMGNVKVPVLDLFGENDLPQVLNADWRRRLALNGIPGSSQRMIGGADHHYTGKESELAAAVRDFIERLK